MVKASDTCATEAVFLHPGLNWNLVQRRRRKNMFKLPHTTLIRPKTQINVFSYARQRIPCLVLAFCTYLYDATENVTGDVPLGHNRFSLITFDQIKLESGKAPL